MLVLSIVSVFLLLILGVFFLVWRQSEKSYRSFCHALLETVQGKRGEMEASLTKASQSLDWMDQTVARAKASLYELQEKRKELETWTTYHSCSPEALRSVINALEAEISENLVHDHFHPEIAGPLQMAVHFLQSRQKKKRSDNG